jgi:hypothetical protein
MYALGDVTEHLIKTKHPRYKESRRGISLWGSNPSDDMKQACAGSPSPASTRRSEARLLYTCFGDYARTTNQETIEAIRVLTNLQLLTRSNRFPSPYRPIKLGGGAS